jgi:hypothetical protein
MSAFRGNPEDIWLTLSSSQFDPGADIVPTRVPGIAGNSVRRSGLVFLALALAGERA